MRLKSIVKARPMLVVPLRPSILTTISPAQSVIVARNPLSPSVLTRWLASPGMRIVLPTFVIGLPAKFGVSFSVTRSAYNSSRTPLGSVVGGIETVANWCA